MKDKSYGVCPYVIDEGSIKILINLTSSVSDYNFFKGKIETNETIKQCAIREFYEETNIKVDIRLLRFNKYFIQTNKRKDIGIFLINFEDYIKDEIVIDPKEIYGYAWLDIKDEIIFSKNQANIFKDIKKYFKGN